MPAAVQEQQAGALLLGHICTPDHTPGVGGSRKCLLHLCAVGIKVSGTVGKLLANIRLDLPPPHSSVVFKSHCLHKAD